MQNKLGTSKSNPKFVFPCKWIAPKIDVCYLAWSAAIFFFLTRTFFFPPSLGANRSPRNNREFRLEIQSKIFTVIFIHLEENYIRIFLCISCFWMKNFTSFGRRSPRNNREFRLEIQAKVFTVIYIHFEENYIRIFLLISCFGMKNFTPFGTLNWYSQN